MADKMEISKETLISIVSEIKEQDAAIGAASGQGANAKKAIRERINAEVQAQAEDVLSKLVKALEKVEDRVLVGVLEGLDTFTSPIKEKANAVIEAEQKAAVPEGATENLVALREKRKATLDKYKAIRTLLDMVGADLSDVEEPKRAGGGGGGGGGGRKAKKGKFTYSIDGQPLSDSQQSFSSLAWYALGKSFDTQGLGHSKYLRKVLEDAQVDSKGEFEFKLPVGEGKTKLITATRNPDEQPAEAEVAAASA